VTGQPRINGTTLGTRVPVFEDWRVFPLTAPQSDAGTTPPAETPAPAAEPPQPAATPGPAFDPIALAEADRIRRLAEAEAETARIKADAEAEARRTEAEGNARAAEILATEEADKQRIINERAQMKLEKDQAAHELDLAEKAAKKAAADAAREKAGKAAEEEAALEEQRTAEQQHTGRLWKWGARGIYAAGLVIAAPIQFLAFWSRSKPFLVAAPVLLEGFALALALGAMWAVAHRRDVLPYRIGIMLGAAVAAGINLWHGINETKIGLNAGIIGALASLGGPIVLMAYEHGMAQKADGIPSRRERRAVRKQAAAERAVRDRARAEREAVTRKAAEEKAARDAAAEAEQRRRDVDRQKQHGDVWKIAEALRSARGSAAVTEQIWLEAWRLATGSKQVGITPEIEALSRAAQERMEAASEAASSHVESQRPPREKRDSDAPDGRIFNGGTPPLRMPGDSPPPSPIACTQARLERTTDATEKDA